MHPSISCISNHLFYQGLIADGVTAEDRASPVPPFSQHPVLFINSLHPEREGEENGSNGKKTYTNPHEAYIIKVYLACFPREELKNVGIITPYFDQLKLLQREFATEVKDFGLTIKTCDGYQGG
jgi:superfamily I DNA and/or RNA helicase